MNRNFDQGKGKGTNATKASVKRRKKEQDSAKGKVIPFFRLVTPGDPSPLCTPEPLLVEEEDDSCSSSLTDSEWAEQPQEGEAGPLQFGGYEWYEEGCPVCGCRELEVYLPSLLTAYQSEPEAGLAPAELTIQSRHRVCGECGLHEEYFDRTLEFQLTGQLLLRELERLEQVISQYRLINTPQTWLAVKVRQLNQAISIGVQTFRDGCKQVSEIQTS